jgi:hypothetical protein
MGVKRVAGKAGRIKGDRLPLHIGARSLDFKLTYRSNDTAHQASAATIAEAGIVMTQA